MMINYYLLGIISGMIIYKIFENIMRYRFNKKHVVHTIKLENFSDYKRAIEEIENIQKENEKNENYNKRNY